MFCRSLFAKTFSARRPSLLDGYATLHPHGTKYRRGITFLPFTACDFYNFNFRGCQGTVKKKNGFEFSAPGGMLPTITEPNLLFVAMPVGACLGRTAAGKAAYCPCHVPSSIRFGSLSKDSACRRTLRGRHAESQEARISSGPVPSGSFRLSNGKNSLPERKGHGTADIFNRAGILYEIRICGRISAAPSPHRSSAAEHHRCPALRAGMPLAGETGASQKIRISFPKSIFPERPVRR